MSQRKVSATTDKTITSVARLVSLAAALTLLLALLPHGASAYVVDKSSPLGKVRYILHGLAVQPPKHPATKGKLEQSLYTRYLLATKRRQKASVAFRDGSLLHINQQTDAILASPSLTQVKAGEVEEQVMPGSSHQIQTAAAVAAAIGTVFDVKVTGKGSKQVTIITVVEGAVLVTTSHGSVVVKSGEQIRVKTGKAPSSPVPVDAAAFTRWTAPIPPPATPLGVNIALAANGGNIYRWSSQRDSPGHQFDAVNANDGRLDRGWQSAAGQTSNQSLWLRFQGLHPYTLTALLLDCAATGGEDAANDAKDFEVKVSATGDAEGSFTPVLDGACQERSGIQSFPLTHPVKATYLELDLKDNQGGTDGIAVAEVGVVSSDEPGTLGTPTPAPTDTPAATPTSTPTSPTPTLTATQVPGQNAVLTASRTGTFLSPPNPLSCGDTSNSQFRVSATGLIPSGAYDLAVTGSAGGVTLDAPVGVMTADGQGVVNGQVFTLPQLPAHHSWTLQAIPRGGGFAPTTALATDLTVCVLPSVENPDRTFTVRWAGSGWKPGGVVTLTVNAVTSVVDQAIVGPDGLFAPRTVTAQCAVGVTPSYTLVGATIDNPNVSVPLANSLPCS